MAASLPRRFSRRSNALDAEREDFLKSQNMAIHKAINTHESAVKQKHLRTVIVGTHKEKGAGTFWGIAGRLPLDGNPIACWKFCHVLHKLLRDGHAHVLTDSAKYRSKLTDLGKLWGHLKDGYGILISRYCKLLVVKLEFHQRHTKIPGNIQLTDEEINGLGDQDMNSWYELAIEMLDYMDEILAVSHEVFNSLDMSRANSLTATGQCRLAPLILCILDSSCLYDCIVKKLFKLHECLPCDTLSGHRDRFNAQFKKLKQFYYTSSNLQYFKYLVSIPALPESPPNFLEASDFDNYVPPRVRMLQDGGSEIDTPPDSRSVSGESTLVDLTEETPPATDNKFDDLFGKDMGQFSFQNGVIEEKDQIINSLRHDLEDSKAAIRRLQTDAQGRMAQYENRIMQLEHEITGSKDVLENMTEENERYRQQSERLQNERNQQTAVSTRLEESERRAQTNEERFKKMKDVYAKLREEHIEQLKRLGELQNELESARTEAMDAQDARTKTERQMQQMMNEQKLSQDSLQRSAAESQDLSLQIDQLRFEVDRLNQDSSAKEEHFASERGRLQGQIETAQSSVKALELELAKSSQNLRDLFAALCLECVAVFEDTLEQFENAAHLSVTCSPEFVLTRTAPTFESFDVVHCAFSSCVVQSLPEAPLAVGLVGFCHRMSELVLYGKATANAAPVDQVQKLTNICKTSAEDCVLLYKHLSDTGCWSSVDCDLGKVKEHLNNFEKNLRGLLGRMGDIDPDEVGTMLDKEMKTMDVAIQAAATKIQDMLTKSRETDSGVRLEVNEKILDACTALMQAVMMLVRKARDLQNEIVAQGRGTGSVHEFYKRHHQWTEGLLSAAKAVGMGAGVLVQSADRVVTGEGKFEELMAASQEIAASTAHLVVASRVKAERGSERLSALSTASKGVTTATASVIGSVKSGQETLTEKESLDFTHMTMHQAKQAEFDTQVKVLELETALANERKRLGQIRKQQYELAGTKETSPSG